MHGSRHRACLLAAVGYAVACVGVIVGAALLSAPARAADLGANMALTSDYVWRGSSQTLEKPAAQAGLKLSGEGGWYASAWGSNVEFAPELEASSEFDLALGWSGAIGGDWALDANLLRYVYPGTTADLDWTEANVAATWRDRAWVGAGWSDDAMATGESGTYVHAGLRLDANDALRFELGAGHYLLDDALGDYSHAWGSAVWAFESPAPDKRVELRVTAHSTDGDAETRFGRDYAGSRIKAALQASF